MAAICIVHPDDPGTVYQVPEPRPPKTFEEVYGTDGYELVPNCPPVPENMRSAE